MENIRLNIKQCVRVVIIAVILLAISSFFAFFNFRQVLNFAIFNNDFVYYFIKCLMIFSFAFFAFGVALIIRSLLFYKDKMIEIKDNYFVDNSSFICGGKIDYSEIESVYIKGSFLCVIFLNEEQFLTRQTFLKRLLMRVNKKMGFEYVTISTNFLNIGLLELEKLLNEKIVK